MKAALLRHLAVALAAEGGDGDQHRARLAVAFAQLLGDVEAAAIGHAEVEKDDVRGKLGRRERHLFAPAHEANVHAVAPAQHAEGQQRVTLVIGNEHPQRLGPLSGLRG